MDFFDKFSEKVVGVGNDLSQKAKEVSSVVSLKNQIRGEQNKIEEIYKRIGKKYFEENSNKQDDVYAEDMASILAAQAGIKTLNDQIREIKGIKVCSLCGTEVEGNASFCTKCGAKIS